jgi:hypothetical protein
MPRAGAFYRYGVVSSRETRAILPRLALSTHSCDGQQLMSHRSPALTRGFANQCSGGLRYILQPRATRHHVHNQLSVAASFSSKQLQPKIPDEDEWDTDWRERRDVDENVYYENISTGKRTVTHAPQRSDPDTPIF